MSGATIGHTALESSATSSGATTTGAAGDEHLHVAAEAGQDRRGAPGLDGIAGGHCCAECGGRSVLVVEDDGFPVGAGQGLPRGNAPGEHRVVGEIGELGGSDSQVHGQSPGFILVVTPFAEEVVGSDCAVHCNSKAREGNFIRGDRENRRTFLVFGYGARSVCAMTCGGREAGFLRRSRGRGGVCLRIALALNDAWGSRTPTLAGASGSDASGSSGGGPPWRLGLCSGGGGGERIYFVSSPGGIPAGSACGWSCFDSPGAHSIAPNDLSAPYARERYTPDRIAVCAAAS
mgnify:CR=1 FL=1